MGETMIKKMVSIVLILALCVMLYKPDQYMVSVSHSLSNKIIVLDPGHGGLDNGATFGKVHEDEINLQISYRIKEELESRGATVYMTRTDDQDMTKRNYNYSKQDDMYLRSMKIDSFKPDLFLSIHLNSAQASAWGSQVFYYKNSEEGKRLAQCIHNHMKTLTNTRKNISSCSFYVLRATHSVGVLIECGFLSNINERGQLRNIAYQKKLARKICDGINEYEKALSVMKL